MSIQLILSHYLSGLRERDELDALLPELLRAMGHSVISRPQVGVHQAGVDVVSTMMDDEGKPEVFLFVIKFGDVGREDFYGSKQAIDPSVREACTDFVRNRLPEELRDARKRIVLLTNGTLKQEAQAGFSGLSKDIAERPLCSLEFWGSDQLTPKIEQFLFDENLLLAKGKSDLRAALAGLEESEAAITRFIRFVDSCFAAESAPGQSLAASRKNFLRRCAAASMGWAVLLVWGQSEGNLKPGVVTGEYLVLRMWSEAVQQDLTGDDVFLHRLNSTVELQIGALVEYFEKAMPYLLNQRSLLEHRPERILYADLVFEELGRLALLGLLLQYVMPNESELRVNVRQNIVTLVNVHSTLHLPVYDGHTIDLTLMLAVLMEESSSENAIRLVSNVADRLLLALKSGKYLPVDSDLLEDAIAVHVTKEAEPRDFFKISTLVPALATVAALLKDEATLACVRDNIQPLLEGVTLERWFPDVTLETLTGSRSSIQTIGVSRSLVGIRATSAEEVAASLQVVAGAAAPADFKWYGTPFSVLAAVSSRFHRHPVPTWFLQQCSEAECEDHDIESTPSV